MQTPRIGHDMVDIARFARAVNRREDAWRGRVFTEGEWAIAGRRPDRMAVLAARFAAKEAALKALGTGWSGGIQWTDVEVVRGGREPPALVLTGVAAQVALQQGVVLQVSLSHTDEMASAVVLAWPSTP